MLTERCLCADLPRLQLASTRLVIVQHLSEARSTTNSARFLHLIFPETLVFQRGERDRTSSDPLTAFDGSDLLLFPDETADRLDDAFLQRFPGPYRLIVPDGRWAQARRIVKREPSLQGLRRVKLRSGPASRFGVRKAAAPELLSTFESVGRALGVLENQRLGDELEVFFERLAQAFRQTRGTRPL